MFFLRGLGFEAVYLCESKITIMTQKLTIEELLEEGMKTHAAHAFIKLQDLGCPVKTWYQNDRGHFWIDSEESSSEEFLDYWNTNLMFGSQVLTDVLEEHGLYFEWQNSAEACVYDN